MTDNEIIKALECCGCPYNRCLECPLCEMERVKCFTELTANALNLINRKNAEIEGLKHNIELLAICKKDLPEQTAKAIKADAIKEFAEKVNEHMCAYDLDNYHWFRAIERDAFNNLVKEMVGDTE